MNSSRTLIDITERDETSQHPLLLQQDNIRKGGRRKKWGRCSGPALPKESHSEEEAINASKIFGKKINKGTWRELLVL